MSVSQFQVVLGGRANGGGTNSWYLTQLNAFPIGSDLTPSQVDESRQALEGFYSDIGVYLADDLTLLFRSEVTTLDPVSGQTLGIISGSLGDSQGSGAGSAVSVSRATHLKLQVRTDTFSDGSRIQGGVFLGPLSDEAINAQGETSTAALNDVSAAAATALGSLASAGVGLTVWRRPRLASAPGGARDGEIALATQVSVWERLAVLRSRRD